MRNRTNRTICLPEDVTRRLALEPKTKVSGLIAELLRAHYRRIDQGQKEDADATD